MSDTDSIHVEGLVLEDLMNSKQDEVKYPEQMLDGALLPIVRWDGFSLLFFFFFFLLLFIIPPSFEKFIVYLKVFFLFEWSCCQKNVF